MVNPLGLPGSIPHGTEDVDKTTFREIYHVARTLEDRCVAKGGRPGKLGWGAVGSKKSLGVFLWATESTMNHDLPHGPSAMIRILNETVRLGVA
ncbi:hypothetical protein Q9189_006805 [Teloschistes chrysophthalmus]